MSFIKITDEYGGDQYLNTANIATVHFAHRQRDIRESITVTLHNGKEMVLPKSYAADLRRVLEAEMVVFTSDAEQRPALPPAAGTL